MTDANAPEDEDDWDETPASVLDPFPSVRESNRLLGVSAEGDPVYYDEGAHARRDAPSDAEAPENEWRDERSLDDDATVGDVVDEVEAAVGWDALTDYAREHLPGVDAEDDADENDHPTGSDTSTGSDTPTGSGDTGDDDPTRSGGSSRD